ncbi:unnamed protein product [Owenia fusiformis]|uniref:Uncharacterized protein n=1 Tax=Owenia fusiformis TaxID=6347 RepID=A0A8S4NWL1_OWEFU|nr:unnamed protein product [Owenia fusiformis]
MLSTKICILVIGVLAHVALVKPCTLTEFIICMANCCGPPPPPQVCRLSTFDEFRDCCCPQGIAGKRSLDEDLATSSRNMRSSHGHRIGQPKGKARPIPEEEQRQIDNLERFVNKPMNPEKDSYMFIAKDFLFEKLTQNSIYTYSICDDQDDGLIFR